MRLGSRGTALAVTAAAIGGALIAPLGVNAAKGVVEDVFVTNTADQPVPVAGTVQVDRDGDPFQLSGTISLREEELSGFDTIPLPAGKDLVIEYVTVAGTKVADGGTIGRFNVDDGEGTGSHQIHVPLDETDGWTAGSEVTSVQFADRFRPAVVRRTGTGTTFVQYTVRGRLIDE